MSFRTSREQLTALLPPRFRIGAEPIVTVEATYLTELPWLAGRGYNIVSVRFPAVFEGTRDRVSGPFVAVLWENLCDPILTGREQLGYSKIFAEISPPAERSGHRIITASWLGFEFLTLDLEASTPVSTAAFVERIRAGQGDGTLHYKYVPRTGPPWTGVDAAYATLSPALEPDVSRWPDPSLWTGTGTVRFRRARWEDMPTQFHIVNALAELEIHEYVGATMSRTVGANDLYDQRVIE